MEKIEISISATGEISYGVSGVKGAKCKDLTRFIDQLGQVTETQTTAEYCAVETNQHLNT